MRVMGKSSLRCALVGVAGWAAIALAGLAAAPPASAAKPVCCFRVSIDVASVVTERYMSSSLEFGGEYGFYNYQAVGSAYALSEWAGGELRPIDSVAFGLLQETPSVTEQDGSGNTHQICAPENSNKQTDPSARLEKASRVTGRVDIHHPYSTFTFGPPADTYKLDCIPLATKANKDLVEVAGDDNWNQQFFASSLIRRLSSSKVAEGHSEHVLCTGHAMRTGISDGPETTRSVDGTYAYYINIVHFPAAEKKRNARRLKGLQNKPVSNDNPAFDAAERNPEATGNGCKA